MIRYYYAVTEILLPFRDDDHVRAHVVCSRIAPGTKVQDRITLMIVVDHGNDVTRLRRSALERTAEILGVSPAQMKESPEGHVPYEIRTAD